MSLDKFRGANFSADDFVERVSRTTTLLFDTAGQNENTLFDPSPLLRTFEEQIEQLWRMHDEVAREVQAREEILREKESQHKQHMEELENTMQAAFSSLQSLSTRISQVSTKTVHVGDQLEAVSTRRRRATEAAEIMRHFAELDREGGGLLPPLDRIDANIHQAADIIQKLKYIADEMPPGHVAVARERIGQLLETVKARLLQGFRRAYGDVDLMREFAHTLYPFQAYPSCVEHFNQHFIEQEYPIGDTNVCRAILATCSKAKAVVDQVFLAPANVFSEFVHTVIDTKLKRHVAEALTTGGPEKLETLHDLYKKSKEMVGELSRMADLGPEAYLEEKLLRKMVFEKYLSSYIFTEEIGLHDNYERALVAFYDSIGHVSWGLRGKEKKSKRPELEDKQSPQETMLSLGVAFNMIHENKRAIERCRDLASAADLPDFVFRVFVKLLEGLCNDHVHYAVNFAVRQLPASKAKGEPPLVFLSVVKDTNSLFYLLQKHYWDDVLPSVRTSLSVYPTCVQRKNDVMESLENQLAQGLAALVDACIDWLKTILAKEQKKTDFKPPEDTLEVINGPCTAACRACVAFLTRLHAQIVSCLNGKNMENVLRHLGKRFYNVLFEHVQQMTFNTLGGMILVRDMSEYERCVQAFDDSVVMGLFVTLRELSAVVIVKAENIKQLCEEGRLATLDRGLIQTFLQLRADYRSAKISSLFKA
eukprot:m.236011 g.236011  ORF g.236011 m.236011 type:complete len:706 (-) comp20395_c0_seq1:75-2192(-)